MTPKDTGRRVVIIIRNVLFASCGSTWGSTSPSTTEFEVGTRESLFVHGPTAG